MLIVIYYALVNTTFQQTWKKQARAIAVFFRNTYITTNDNLAKKRGQREN